MIALHSSNSRRSLGLNKHSELVRSSPTFFMKLIRLAICLLGMVDFLEEGYLLGYSISWEKKQRSSTDTSISP